MNIIFLDIDGVFNSERLVDKMISKGYTDAQYDFIDSEELETFIKFIDKYNISIVISSSWRIDGYKETCDYLKKTLMAPIIPYIIGVTPRSQSGFRGTEIDFFIYVNKVNHEKYHFLMKNNIYINIDEYCIIDDDDDMTDEQKEYHFIQTNYEIGLNKEHYPLIKKILKL